MRGDRPAKVTTPTPRVEVGAFGRAASATARFGESMVHASLTQVEIG